MSQTSVEPVDDTAPEAPSDGGDGSTPSEVDATERSGRDDGFWGWVGAIALAAIALIMRRWRLGEPAEFSFDETYYAKDAWSLLNNGYIRTYVEGADTQILSGHTLNQFAQTPSMAVHPDVGKWLIALGEKAFGMDPYGWRIASAVVGALMVLVMCRFVRRVTGSTVLGLVGGALLAFDGLHFVLSRLALLDLFLAFFVLCGVHCAVADRQWIRAKYAAGATRRLWRPWLFASGLMFGLAVGTKWSGAYALAAFGLMVFFWSWGARRAAEHKGAWWRALLIDGPTAFAHMVLVALVVYVISWTGWLMHASEYEQALSNTQYATYEGGQQWPTATEPDAEGIGEVTQSLRSLWHYHHDVYIFHTKFLNDATHPYASGPAKWPVLGRSVGVSATNGIQPGVDGCDAPTGSNCLKQVVLLGNPAVWWLGSAAMVLSVIMWAASRDWRHGVAVVGMAATWLPWFMYDDRPVYLFYAIVSLPFLILSLTLALGMLIGPESARTARRTAGLAVTGAVVVATIGLFVFFWPIYTNGLLTHEEWMSRMWFRSWI